jgi:hypothetical protein
MDFLDFYESLPSNDIALFSDGSQLANGKIGCWYVGYQDSQQIFRGSFSLGSAQGVFDAEAKATLAGVKAALNSPASRHANNLWVFLDNLEVAVPLLAPLTGSSQSTFESFRELAINWPRRERLPNTLPGAVYIVKHCVYLVRCQMIV